MDIREELSGVNEEMLFLEGREYDEALIGYAERISMGPVAAYDRELILQILMRDGMTEEEAWEHFDYNILGSWVGESTPIFITFRGGFSFE